MILMGCMTVAQGADTEELKLRNSPRLWVSEDTALNLKDKLHSPYMQSQAKRILADADWLLDAKPIAPDEGGTNQHRTRAIASHLQTLTSAWVLTHDKKYRAGAMKHLGNVMNFNQISCEANHNTPADRQMFFCLSYGEHAADIALMYDLFRPEMTDKEMKVFNDVLDKFYLKEALRCAERHPWWVNKQWSNWNGVCAGGMGMLALALYEDRPECRKLIPFVEKSLGEYFKSYIENGGGCHEGTGYWNYGMHYAMRYLLSWENATGKKHPAFEIKEIAMSLNFPLDFTGLTFGDNDGWHPSGMFFMLTKRLNQPGAAVRAAAHLPERVEIKTGERSRLRRTAFADILYGADCIPTKQEMDALRKERAAKKEPLARVYEGLEWAALADDTVFPALRLSARGGTSKISGHGHLDLLAFKCMINGERMIEDQGGGGYNSVTFSSYGHRLYARSPAGKSSIFVDGLGCREDATCELTEIVKGEGLTGIRIDGARIFLPRWRGRFIGRLFLMVENRYWLVIDAAPGHGLESRFHTYADFTNGEDWILLKKGKEQMMMTLASIGTAKLQQSRGMPTRPGKQSHIFRWMSTSGSTHVTALNPGSEKLGLKLSKGKDGGFDIEVSGKDGYKRTVKVTSKLELKPSL